MVNTRDNYQQPMIVAARQVLLELAHLLEEERDSLVFVGGTACALLFPQDTDPHEGTIDIDVALDPVALAKYGEDTLEERLLYGLYQQEPGKKYRWIRSLPFDGQYVDVKIDLLSGEYDDSQRHTEAREVQGLFASVLRGLDLAFLDPRRVLLSGLLPDGRPCQTEIQVCSPASLLAMKGIAIRDRMQGKDKDAYDIDYLLRRYEGGIDALARVLQTDVYWTNSLVHEGLAGIAEAFGTLDALGPVSVAAPSRFPDSEERAIVQQGAFQRVQRLLRLLASHPRAVI